MRQIIDYGYGLFSYYKLPIERSSCPRTKVCRMTVTVTVTTNAMISMSNPHNSHSDLSPELSNFINYVANSGALKTPLGIGEKLPSGTYIQALLKRHIENIRKSKSSSSGGAVLQMHHSVHRYNESSHSPIVEVCNCRSLTVFPNPRRQVPVH